MSQQQGLIIVVTDDKSPTFAAVLSDAMFPLIETSWTEAPRAITQLHPAAVIAAAGEGAKSKVDALARQTSSVEPYLPLIIVDPQTTLPENAVPFSQAGDQWARLVPRLRSALRLRTLHTTVLRRM